MLDVDIKVMPLPSFLSHSAHGPTFEVLEMLLVARVFEIAEAVRRSSIDMHIGLVPRYCILCSQNPSHEIWSPGSIPWEKILDPGKNEV